MMRTVKNNNKKYFIELPKVACIVAPDKIMIQQTKLETLFSTHMKNAENEMDKENKNEAHCQS